MKTKSEWWTDAGGGEMGKQPNVENVMKNKQNAYIPLALDWNILSNSCVLIFTRRTHTNTLRVEIEAGELKWLVIISSQQHTNRKYQHLAYFHTFTLDTDVRLNCQDIVCTIAFKSTTAEHKKNDAWLYFESDKWTIFLLFLQVFCNFPASAFAFAIPWNGGKNEENLSFVQHLMCSHSLIYCVQCKSFAIHDIVERHSRISRITNELQIKTYSVNDYCGIFYEDE